MIALILILLLILVLILLLHLILVFVRMIPVSVKNTPPEKNTLQTISLKDSKSGAGEEFMLLLCGAKAL